MAFPFLGISEAPLKGNKPLFLKKKLEIPCKCGIFLGILVASVLIKAVWNILHTKFQNLRYQSMEIIFDFYYKL